MSCSRGSRSPSRAGTPPLAHVAINLVLPPRTRSTPYMPPASCIGHRPRTAALVRGSAGLGPEADRLRAVQGPALAMGSGFEHHQQPGGGRFTGVHAPSSSCTRDVDARTDQYSSRCCCTCAWLEDPFKGDSLFPVLAAVQGGDLTSRRRDCGSARRLATWSNVPCRTLRTTGTEPLGVRRRCCHGLRLGTRTAGAPASAWDGSGASEAHPDTCAAARHGGDTCPGATPAWTRLVTAPDATELKPRTPPPSSSSPPSASRLLADGHPPTPVCSSPRRDCCPSIECPSDTRALWGDRTSSSRWGSFTTAAAVSSRSWGGADWVTRLTQSAPGDGKSSTVAFARPRAPAPARTFVL